MATGSRVCPSCGALNSRQERRCHRCAGRLGPRLGDWLVTGLRSLFGQEVPVTSLVMGLCVLVYGAGLVTGASPSPLAGATASTLLRWGALHSALSAQEPWRYASAIFVHAGVLHLVFNLSALWSLGSGCERRLGSGRFAVLFVLSGVVGFVFSDYWARFSGHLLFTVGSSGSIFGLSGALVGYLAARRDPAWKHYLLQVVILAAVLQLLPMGVDTAAHLGGLAAGIALGYAFHRERRPYQRARLFGWVGGLLLASCMASVVLCNLSPQWTIQRSLEQLRSDP
jgi:membrane associated rhomboid family serine protease